MDRRQYLLLKLAEECNEVAHIAIKQMQFGKENKQPGQDKTNAQLLLEELIDLETIAELLHGINELDNPTLGECEEMAAKKKLKIEKYYKYSQDLGFVDKEDK